MESIQREMVFRKQLQNIQDGYYAYRYSALDVEQICAISFHLGELLKFDIGDILLKPYCYFHLTQTSMQKRRLFLYEGLGLLQRQEWEL